MLTTIPDNFIYFGLFLTDKSREKLMNFVQDNLKNTVNRADKLYLDHITLLHKNDKRSTAIKLRMYELLNYMLETFIGETYEVKIIAFGLNDKAAAFKVELSDGFPCFIHKTYHITIATFNGVKPVESNNIINWRELNESITVTTILTKTIYENNLSSQKTR